MQFFRLRRMRTTIRKNKRCNLIGAVPGTNEFTTARHHHGELSHRDGAAAAEIDVEAKTSPIRFDPPVDIKFIWKSQTEGEFTAGMVQPGTEYKVYLATGLVDLAGKPVEQVDPLGTRVSDPFNIDCDFRNSSLERRPAVPLRFSLSIKASDLLETAWFQDRDSRKRVPGGGGAR